MNKNYLKIIGFLLVLVIVTFTYITSNNDELINIIFLIFLVLTGILVSIIGLFRYLLSKKSTILCFGIYIILLCFPSYFIRNSIMNDEILHTQTNARVIINSIEKYYDEKKQYPSAIDDLKPNYLTTIPQRFHYFKQNTEFEYVLEASNKYYLAYDVNERMPMFYYSDTKDWIPRPKG